jgi:hypothetical protein
VDNGFACSFFLDFCRREVSLVCGQCASVCLVKRCLTAATALVSPVSVERNHAGEGIEATGV